MGVKLGLSQFETNTGWGCLKIVFWGRYFGLNWKKYCFGAINCTERCCMICTRHHLLTRWLNRGGHWDWWGMWHEWGKKNSYRDLVRKPESSWPFGGPRHRRENNNKLCLKGMRWRAWIWLIWLRTETSHFSLTND